MIVTSFFRPLLTMLLCGLVAFAVSACESSSGGGPGKPAPDRLGAVGGMDYKLGVGDKVKVVVLGQSDLGGDLEVDAGGKIVVALIGEVSAAGRTVGEVQDEIRAKFSQGILREPRVTVQVVGYRPVTVLGQVRQPGRYPFASGLDVRGAAAMAGGYERRASVDSAIIFRGGEKLEGKADTPLLPGDTVDIPRKFF
ncbi:MAG: polysaccharide biosynthesis/export family protein [Alphaproteobacteria bacterium]|nr:polysaccharide biosynthesis/export family protein [Alphaproteobacteria bacterium]MCW5740908.1 polysaccharide biosynthesis/export family protein [Alphaproteobacteria bacterium]